jgi:ribulose-5-phosphate 4-epimerase/fuculose-1-phosphate aldolase
MSSVVQSITPHQGNISPEEWQVRVDLAAAYRLVALFGWDDLIFTHLSVCAPDNPAHFLINPLDRLFDQITASSLVKIDLDGNKVDDNPVPINAAGFVIHSAIHAARPDAVAVFHLHTPYGQAVSAMECGILPTTQTSMVAYHHVAYHDYEGIATDLDERERLVADLGSKSTMLLRNHGTLSVGPTIPQAFHRIYNLERACEAQVHMLAAGRDGIRTPPADVIAKVGEQVSRPRRMNYADELIWPALLRRLDGIDPSYRT